MLVVCSNDVLVLHLSETVSYWSKIANFVIVIGVPMIAGDAFALSPISPRAIALES